MAPRLIACGARHRPIRLAGFTSRSPRCPHYRHFPAMNYVIWLSRHLVQDEAASAAMPIFRKPLISPPSNLRGRFVLAYIYICYDYDTARSPLMPPRTPLRESALVLPATKFQSRDIFPFPRVFLYTPMMMPMVPPRRRGAELTALFNARRLFDFDTPSARLAHRVHQPDRDNRTSRASMKENAAPAP